jgi:hemerythrin-like domain-containing protein
MNEKEASPVVNGLLLIHKIITRGLTVCLQKCDEYLENKGVPTSEAAGFTTFISTLTNVTHAHHLSEDEISFPYFREYIEAPFDRLKEDHQDISHILDRIGRNLQNLTTDEITGLLDTLKEFQAIWVPHIQLEEENFTAQKVQDKVSLKDQIAIAKKMGAHGSRNSGPGPLALPFLFYNLEGMDRETFMKSFPMLVRKLLVPVIWKSQWKPMSPFLLY